MQQKKMTKSKIAILSIGAVLLALVLVLSGVGIYFKLNRKEKPVEVNPLDFSVDAWDGTVSGVSFNEAYAGRSVKTKTINSASAFAHFVNEVNSGNTFEGYTIYLNSNIDLKNKTINPIGTFKGTFDGGHYTILNAKVKGKALFDNVENATIKNIGLYNSNCNLINTAVNSNIENTFVRLGSGNLVAEFISNNGPHFIKNSFVDSSAENLINKLDTNNSQENEVTISNCYYTSGLVAVKEKVGESFVVEDKVVCPTDKNSFAEFNYTAEYSTSTEWCDYDYLAGSKKLDFVYPLQSGFVKVFLTGSCYESVMVAGDTVIDSTNLAHAFTEADKEEIAEVNLLVEKIFMEAKAEVETSNVTINAMKDTTIIRGENNTESMFVSKGDSTISIGINNNAGVSSGTQTNETKKITIDGNRSYIEKNELESNALIVSYGGKVDIGENVVIKNNINNSEVGYGGAVLLYNTSEVANISATFENCHSEKGGGAVAIIGSQVGEIGSFYNCSAKGNGGAIYIAKEIEDEASLRAIHTTYGNGMNVRPTESEDRIEIDYSLEIDEDLLFEGCHSEESGGAVCIMSGNLTISGNPTFRENTARYGGAICVDSEEITITGNPEFIGNVAEECGGAIDAYYGAEISGNPTFESNNSNQWGGAIHTIGTGGVIISGDASFSGNNAYCGGGAIYAEDGVTISGDVEFAENISEENGSAIYSNSLVEISGNSTFLENQTYSFSGAILAQDVIISGSSTFSLNTTGAGSGGAIYAKGDVEISGNPTFTNNTAGENGGAIYADGDVTISGNPTFNRNKTESDGGGAIYAKGDVTISGKPTFFANGSEFVGGAIHSKGNVTISGEAIFRSNSATNTSMGGAINASTVDISSNAIFEGNSSGDGAGAISATTVTISGDAIFKGNTAENYNGGAIYATTVNILGNPSFENNSSEYEGGAIYATTVTISGNPTFNNNGIYTQYFDDEDYYTTQIVTVYGGAIWATTVNISGEAIFAGNSVNSEGGAICSNGSITISGDAQFNNNTASGNGGAIYAEGDVEISSDATFSNNTTAICANGDVTVSGESIFTGNRDDECGAICANGDVTISGKSTFSDNVGYSSGAIFSGGDVTISGDAQFINNESSVIGGAIYAEGNVTISGEPTFSKNSAGGSGGAICADGDVEISGDATFTNNWLVSKYQYGGAIYAYAVTISGNAIFNGNYVNGDRDAAGGAISAEIVTISGGAIFNGNYANSDRTAEAGAISAVTVTVSGEAQFFNNESKNFSAICAADVLISGNTIFANNEDDYGGVISADNVTISGYSIFSNNVTGVNGIITANNVAIIEPMTYVENQLHCDNEYYSLSELQLDFMLTAYPQNDSIQLIQGIDGWDSIGIASEGYLFSYEGSTGALPIFVPLRLTVSYEKLSDSTTANYTVIDIGSNGALFRESYEESVPSAMINPTIGGSWTLNEEPVPLFVGEIKITDSNGVHIYNTQPKTTSKVVFSGNKAGDGGAIYASNYVTITSNAEFYNNTSELGGAIYSEGDVVLGGETVFKGNNKEIAGDDWQNGGAIYATTTNIAGKAQFINNGNASNVYSGGAIYGRTYIYGEALFRGNAAVNGGAIEGYVEISGHASFEKNIADYGGAIYSEPIEDEDLNYFAVVITGTAEFIENHAYNDSGDAIEESHGGYIVINGEITLKNNKGTRDIYSVNGMQIGADIHYMNDDENHYAIYLNQDRYLMVTQQLTKRIPVYKEGVAVYNNNSTASYIFNDSTAEGLTGVTSSFPFKVINAPAGTGIDFNNKKATFGVVASTKLDASIKTEKSVNVMIGNTSTFTYQTDAAGTMNFVSSDTSKAKVVNYTKNVQANTEYTCTIEGVVTGDVEILSTFTPNTSTKGATTETVYVSVEKLDSAITLSEESVTIQYPNEKIIKYKSTVAGTFTVTCDNPAIASMTYTANVIGGVEYSALIKTKYAGSANFTFAFVPNGNDYSIPEDKTLAVTVTKAKLDAPTNVRLTNNKHNNAKTLLTWDAVTMPGVYVTYLVKVGHRYTEEYEEGQYRDTVYSWVEATTSSTSFDFYEIIQPYLNCSDTADGEYCCIVYARSNNTNICANSSQSDFSNTFNVAFFGGSDYIINGVWVDEETKYLIEGEICELKAGYLPENYEFVSWYCESDGEFEFGNINSATTTFKMSETNFDTFYEISYSAKLKTNDITAISNNGAFGSVTAFTEAPISNTFTVAGNVISIKNSSNKVVKTITATPKESDPQYCYKFVGWTGLPLDNKFTEDTTIVANFVRIINTYTIKFEVETDSNEFGSVDTASVTANYGELVTFKGNIITVGSDTIKAEALADTAKYTYDFDSWLNKIEVLEGNVTIKAVFNRVHNSYKVTFDANTGTITSGDSEKTLLYEDEYGTLPTASKPGYEFNGWKTKNLIPYPFVASYNDKFVSHEDQSITINVDAQEGWPAFRFVENKTIKAGKYVFSVFDKNGGAIGLENISFVIAYSDNSGKTQYLGAKSGEIVNVQNDLDYKVMYIQVSPNLTVKGTFFFQLEAGDTATEYSPYVNYSGDKLSETDKLLTWGDHILIADWVAEKYTVTFDAGEGEITEGSSSVELAYKDSYGTLPVASREGYTFNGWKTKNMLDTQNAKVYHNNPYSPLYDWERTDSGFKATLLNSSDNYIWSRHGFQIGNTQDLIGKTITVSFGEYIGKSQKPIIQFIATDLVGEPAANFTGVETFSNGYMGSSGLITVLKNGANYNEGNKLTYTIGEDITQQYIGVLFYLCVEEYVEKGDQFEYKNIQVEIGDTATDYSPYVIYAGNYLDASDKVLTIGDHILVADWTPNTYDVTFDANGGSITEGESTKEVTFDSAYGELPSAEKIGHTFDGWYTESSGGTKVTHETIVKIAEDHTLYAHYTINTFTVTIKVNDTERGKVNGQDSITLTLDWGSPIAGGVSETITIDGTVYTAQASAQNDKYSYAFENWTLTGGGTIPLTVTSDLEFVANFDRTARKYQITYDLVVDGITLDNPSEYTAETPTFTLNNPTHDVYEFVGWREEGVEGIKEVVTIEQGSTGPKHFVAVWNKLVVIQASGNNANNTYSVKVEDANGNEVGTYTKSFNVHVGEKYTFKVNANVTSDANNNAYQILKTILVIGNSSETKFVTYSPEHTSIKDSTIINKSAIDDNTMIKFEYLDAYQLVVENSALIAGLTIDIVDNGQDVIVQRANGNYVIANTTRVEFEVNSTPATNATESAYIGLTFEANGQTSTVGVTGGNGIQFVNFKHNPSYADDANVGTYTYKINNTKVSKITINVVETKVVNIVTSAIPTGKSITIESAHGLNKVIDKYTGAVKLYDGIWTIVATTLTLDEIKLVFPNYTVTSSNGVITVEVK